MRVIIRTPTDGRTDGQTDRQTDRRTDEQGESSIPPLNFVAGGIIRHPSILAVQHAAPKVTSITGHLRCCMMD